MTAADAAVALLELAGYVACILAFSIGVHLVMGMSR